MNHCKKHRVRSKFTGQARTSTCKKFDSSCRSLLVCSANQCTQTHHTVIMYRVNSYTDKYQAKHTYSKYTQWMSYVPGACLIGNSTGVPECMAVQRRLKLIVYGLYNKLYIEVSYRTPPIELSCQGTQSIVLKNTSAEQKFVDTA